MSLLSRILTEVLVLYKKYRAYLFPIAIFIVAAFVLVQVTLPQFFLISATRGEIDRLKQEISDAQSTLSVVSSLDDKKLDQELDVVRTALPDTKDFIGIFLALNSSSLRSGVELGDFSLTIGKVYGKAEKGTQANPAGVLSLSMSFDARASNPRSLTTFAEELQKILPIAEVKKLGFSENSGHFDLLFYYKPYNLSLISSKKIVPQITSQEEAILSQLSEWK